MKNKKCSKFHLTDAVQLLQKLAIFLWIWFSFGSPLLIGTSMLFFGDKVLRRKDPRIKIKQIRKVSSGGLAQAKSHAKQAY